LRKKDFRCGFSKRNFQMLKIKSLLSDESGATAVEYGLIIALVAAISMTTIKTLGQNLATHWQAVEKVIPADVGTITAPTAITVTTGNP
jgi:pilus assembly protein Flp/PilA